MNREELKIMFYADYTEKSKSKEYPGVIIFYITKTDGLNRLTIPTNLTEEEFYKKLANLELQEGFEGYIGEDAVMTRCVHHFSRPSGAYGPAIDRVCMDYKGRMFVTNGEYSTRVNYCPFTGQKAVMQMTQTEQEIDGKITYNYE